MCIDLIFCKKKQIAVEVINSFVKRLALMQMHLLPSQQASLLLLLKQMLNRYPSARSSMLDFEDDSVGGGFATTPNSALYKGELNDP